MTSTIGPFAEVRRHLDRPAVFVDGRPYPSMAWMSNIDCYGADALGRPEYIKSLWKTGIRIYFLPASAHAERWSQTSALVASLLESCPGAFIIFRVEQNSMSPDWIAAHPYDLFRFSDGTSDVLAIDYMEWASKHTEEQWFDEADREAFFRRGFHAYWELAESYERNREASFASSAWRGALEEGLRAFISRVQESTFADRVIGYFHAFGRWESFFICASIDYSSAMRDAFRRWVEARYEGDAKRLRRAWNDSDVTFERVEPPTQGEGGLGDVGFFRSPGAKQKVIDYFHCHNEAVADTIIHMASAAKDSTARSKIAGFSYGYYVGTNYSLTGHSALRKVLACNDVDFIESCVPYEGRPAGNDHPFPTVVDSLKSEGKVFWYEADIRTHLFQDKEWGVNYGSPKTEAGSVSILTREFAHYLISGIQAYWFDQRAMYYDDRTILALFDRFQRIGVLSLQWPLGRTAEICLFIDEDSFFPAAQEVSINVLHRQRIQEMGRIGVPYDVRLIEDITRDDLPDYRLCVFPNAFSLDRAERQMIRDSLCRKDRLILWHYAPGLIDPDSRTLDPANMESLTGISFDWIRAREHLELTLTGEPDWLAAGFTPTFTFGDFRDKITTGSGIGLGGRESITPPAVMGDPVFVVRDADATVAARYTWDDLPGMAVKSLEGWTSVYTATLCLPHEILANIADRAGVHRYSAAGDVVYANDRFLAVHTRAGGVRTIRLRTPNDVINALTGELIARNAESFDVTLPECTTTLYFLGAASDWPADLSGHWRGP